MVRRTNTYLLVLLATAFLTGWLAFAFATAPARWSLVIHATAGVGVAMVTPWKSLIARHGLERRRPGWWASLLLAVLVLVSLAAGLLHSTGLLLAWGGFTAMEIHVGAAIAAVPFALWHVLARPAFLRRTDLSRRYLMRGGALLAASVGTYSAGEGVVRLFALPGARRRFTGSYDAGSLQPQLLPATQWLFDQVPDIEAGA